MTVYVDQLRTWGKWKYGESCHMLPHDLTETSIAELHTMAERIGMKRAWFQAGRWPHYDLTAGRRQKALAAGCVEISAKEWMRRAQARPKT